MKRRRRAPTPTEGGTDTERILRKAAVDILRAIGEDPTRPGLLETPRRFASWLLSFSGYDPGNMTTTFPAPANGGDQLVMVTGLRVWSLCEHHILPFYCDLTIGYVPRAKVLGLSKFGRIAHARAHGLQIQERLAGEIADDVAKVTESHDVAVLAAGEHLCMTMRGIRTPARLISSVLRGAFLANPALRAEFMNLATNHEGVPRR